MKKPKEEELSFEQAFSKLEEMVEQLEDGDIPLAEMVDAYEKGTTLLRQCHQRLAEAETRIEQIRQEDGKLLVETMTPEDSQRSPEA